MCTVTYIPTSGGFILTSSRDEQIKRPTLAPALYQVEGKNIVFPKDEIAGGTWIAADLIDRKACLLNGAFFDHIKKPHYNVSRGKILIESFSYQSIHDFVKHVNLQNVEPFTLLLFQGNINPDMYSLIWDGENKHFTNLNYLEPQIWSSATLYNKNQSELRARWFFDWLNNNNEHSDYRISDFHLHHHTTEIETDILMKRNNFLQTLSVSQIRSTDELNEFIYVDLLSQQQSNLNLKDLGHAATQNAENGLK